MIAAEIATLIAMVRALCPAQKFDEHTPDAWLFVLEDLPFADARAALKTLGQTKAFISPADIHGEVKRVRGVRAAAFVDYADTLPDADPDDVEGYLRALRQGNYRAAQGELHARPVQQAIETCFVRVESAWSRSAGVPLRPLPPIPADDPELDAARDVLGAMPQHEAQRWLAAARTQLETGGTPLANRDVAIRAAELATRSNGAV